MGVNLSAERELEASKRHRSMASDSSLQGHTSLSNERDTGPIHRVGDSHSPDEHVGLAATTQLEEGGPLDSPVLDSISPPSQRVSQPRSETDTQSKSREEKPSSTCPSSQLSPQIDSYVSDDSSEYFSTLVRKLKVKQTFDNTQTLQTVTNLTKLSPIKWNIKRPPSLKPRIPCSPKPQTQEATSVDRVNPTKEPITKSAKRKYTADEPSVSKAKKTKLDVRKQQKNNKHNKKKNEKHETTTNPTKPNPQYTKKYINNSQRQQSQPSQRALYTSTPETDSEVESTTTRNTPEDTQQTHTTHKWEYVILSTTNATDLGPGEHIKDRAHQLPGSFVLREEANTELEKMTAPDQFDDGGAVVEQRRYTYVHTPNRQLRVELTLAGGEQRVLWVERRLVDLRHDLKANERRLKKWSGARVRLPLYIVQGEMMLYATTEEPQQLRQWDEGGDVEADADVDGGGGSNEMAVELPCREVVGSFSGVIKPNKLQPRAFTVRKLANEHAAWLFLELSKVREEARGPLDDYWWHHNAVPVHKEAERRAKGVGDGDGLYVADLETSDMRTRLGFDRFRIVVYANDDVEGPLNI
ncbi:hypothetical protein F4779DRAFT_207535 [Xylariaceae sp. FL0662B]|nr:hypothetical protein F4779DRAFT_207535 [Xylariaceae sp. FL0662B]